MDDYRAENPANDAAQVNEFDFSTVNNVALTVDYSACDPVTPVFFRVYNENPFEGDELNKNIKPIYSNFTDANGRFSQTIELPSYAEDLYIFTGDFFIDEQLMNAKVTDNRAIAKANSSQAAAARRRVSQGSGVLTDEMTYLYQTSYEVDFTTGDNTGNQIYNDWKTWLGKWDSRTGRPDYLLNRYIYHVVMNQKATLQGQVRKASIPRLPRSAIDKLIVPVPPVEVQSEIIRILDAFIEKTNELSNSLEAERVARKKQYVYYRDSLLTFGLEVQHKRLGELFPFIRNGFVGTITPYFTDSENGVRYKRVYNPA